MPGITYWGNGTAVTFKTPSSPLTKTAAVSGVPVAILSQTATSVTLASAPGERLAVDIVFEDSQPVGLSAAQLAAGGFLAGPKVQKIRRAIAAARASNAIINAPIPSSQVTVTAANNGALTTLWRPDPAAAATPQLFNTLGGTWIQYNAVPGFLALGNNKIAGFPVYSNTVLEWMSDAPQLVFNATQGTYLITVDDRPLISFAGVPTDTGGGLRSLSIDWTVGGTITDPTVTRQARRYRVVTNGVNWIGRIATDAASRVWAPSKDDLVRAYIIGDSYTADTSETAGMLAHQGLTYQYCTRLGFVDVWKDGVGGSGYFAVGSGRTAIQAVPGAIAANPDVVVIPLGVNDAGQPSATITSLALQVLQALRAGLAGTPIVVVGPWAENTGPSANVISIENALAAAVAAMNDPLIVFVPQVTDPAGSWLFGTGNSTSGTGNVPAYFGTSGIHPSTQGHYYLGVRMAAAIGNALAKLLGVS